MKVGTRTSVIIMSGIMLICMSWKAHSQDATGAKGQWICGLDAGNGVPQTEPPRPIVHQQWGLAANGSVVADLAAGGPSGVFLYVHLHGVQNDRYGEAQFWMGVLVKDDSGYYYMVTPSHYDTVHGVLDKPQRHIHCAGQFTPVSGDLKEAVARKIPLHLEFLGGRSRTDLGGDLEAGLKNAVGEYLNGKLTSGALLGLLNQGKAAFGGAH